MSINKQSSYAPKSAGMIFLVIGATIFAAEALVMFILSYVPEQPVFTGAMLDSTLLLLLVSPALYYFLFRPMVSHIREHEKIQGTLRKNEEEQFKIMVRSSLDGFMIVDREGRFLEVNDAYCKLLGYSRDELLQIRVSDIEAHEDTEETTSHIMRSLKGGQEFFQACQRHKDGHLIDLEVSANYSNLYGGRFYSFLRDISERKKNEEQIYNLAHLDILTGLTNRSLLNDRLQQAIIAAAREKSHLALLFIDLDKFKPINDSYGHDVGDQVLKHVAGHMRECVREADTIARVGGDEFVILLPTLNTEQDAILVGNKILSALKLPFDFQNINITITASIGIAIYPEHGSDAKTLIKNADAAMYWAKDGGRDNVKLYQSGMAIN